MTANHRAAVSQAHGFPYVAASRTQVEAREALSLLTVAVALCVILAWRWIGYQGSDDNAYAQAALDWIHDFPALGDTHWALRYTIVLPIAACFALFGMSEHTLALPNLLYFLGFLAVTWVYVRRLFGPVAALAALVLFIASPAFLVNATYINTDMSELFFVSVSVWAFLEAYGGRAGNGALLLSGAAAGLAFLSRETTLALLIVFGLLFLFRPRIARWRYLLMGAAFAGIAALQMAYFWAMTGNPLHRLDVSSSHDRIDRAAEVARVKADGMLFDTEGVLSVGVFVDPFLTIFISQKFGFLFLLGVPAVFLALRRRTFAGPQREAILFMSLLAAVWFAFIAANTWILYLVPRYFMVSGFAVGVVLAAVIGWGAERIRWRVPAWFVLLGLGASGLGLLYLENVDPLYEEHILVETAAAAPEPVHVDPVTATRSKFLLQAAGLEHRVRTTEPPPGALVVYKRGVIEECDINIRCTVTPALEAYRPAPNWTVVAEIEPDRRAIGALLTALGLETVIPRPLWLKIVQPNAGVTLYRVREDPPALWGAEL